MMSDGSGHPPLEPPETLLAHPGGQDRDAAAAHDPRDRHAAPTVVAGGRPERLMGGRVELAGDHARREAGVGGQHLVRANHRKAVAERHDDGGLGSRERLGQDEVIGHGHASAPRVVVEPVHAEQIECVRRIRIDGRECGRRRGGNGRGVGQLREGRQHHAGVAEAPDAAAVQIAIDDISFESQSGHRFGSPSFSLPFTFPYSMRPPFFSGLSE